MGDQCQRVVAPHLRVRVEDVRSAVELERALLSTCTGDDVGKGAYADDANGDGNDEKVTTVFFSAALEREVSAVASRAGCTLLATTVGKVGIFAYDRFWHFSSEVDAQLPSTRGRNGGGGGRRGELPERAWLSSLAFVSRDVDCECRRRK